MRMNTNFAGNIAITQQAMIDRLSPPLDLPVLARRLWRAAGHDESDPPTELVETLGPLLESCREAWPTVQVDVSSFVDRLGASLSPDQPIDSLRRIHVSDLFLSHFCLQGHAVALDIFNRRFLGAIGQSVRRLDPTPQFADEVGQQLAERLLVGEAGRVGPRLETYRGQGPLAHWMAVAAQRTGLNLLRLRRREVPIEDDMEAAISSVVAPELQMFREQHRLMFQKALQDALQSLPARERTILRLNLVAGVSLLKIGKMYGVNQSTVSRWVASAREAILAHMEADLAKAHLRPEDLASLVRLVRSQVDLAMSASGEVSPEIATGDR
jgi:RNA polymerase sigma-70 factor (ECF subfamily)